MTAVVAAKKLIQFDPQTFLSTMDGGRKIAAFAKKRTIFVQGDAADAVFYIQKGKVKLTVVSQSGKEATIGILNQGDFFGEGCLTGQPLRLYSATAMTDCLAACKTAAITVSATSVIAIATASVKASTIPPTSIPSAPVKARPVKTASVEAVVPGASADKDTTSEPSRTVVAVRCARIGIIAVVAVRTCRRGSDVSRTNHNTNRNPCVGESRRKNEHTQQSEIS